MRGLEEDLGVRLLSRTTRSVAPTEAGERLLARLRPALSDVQDVLGELSDLRDKPAGRVRLLIPRLAGLTVLGTKLAKFTRDYPDVVLDITADDSRMDIVAGGFDAGIHFGEYIQKDPAETFEEIFESTLRRPKPRFRSNVRRYRCSRQIAPLQHRQKPSHNRT